MPFFEQKNLENGILYDKIHQNRPRRLQSSCLQFATRTGRLVALLKGDNGVLL